MSVIWRLVILGLLWASASLGHVEEPPVEPAWRIGYGAHGPTIEEFPPAAVELGAGWYYDWLVRVEPQRPAGIEYVQLINMHQRLTCPIGTTGDRTLCPYVSPPEYELTQPLEEIEAAARANPGSTWLLGNEVDVLDGPGYYQNEMEPALYAVAYYDLYTLLKNADPTAIVAPAGLSQFTPLRRTYLNTVLATYRRLYGTLMPVDLWNIHGYILPELCRMEEGQRVCYGAGVPPGSPLLEGAHVGEEWRHTDVATFQAQLLDFRAWLDSRGYGGVPFMVSEYGVLFDTADDAEVRRYMWETFDWMTRSDLVQRWAWFLLVDDGKGFHRANALVDGSGLTLTGESFARFVRENASLLERIP